MVLNPHVSSSLLRLAHNPLCAFLYQDRTLAPVEWADRNVSPSLCCVCVYVCICVHMCVHVCDNVCACVCANLQVSVVVQFNSAVVSAGVNTNNIDLCSWESSAAPFFDQDNVFRWDFMAYE